MDDTEPTFEMVLDDEAISLAHTAVKWMADYKQRFRAAQSESERFAAADRLLKWSLQAVFWAVGPQAMKILYGPAVTENRHAALHRLWDRLRLVEALFDTLPEPKKDLASIGALRDELLAVACGDAPRLTATLDKRVKYRRDHLLLNALGWDAYLQAKGMPAHKAQAKIADAFGRTWVAIFIAKKRLEQNLGADNVAMHLQLARVGHLHYAMHEDYLAALKSDGDAFLKEDYASAAANPRH